MTSISLPSQCIEVGSRPGNASCPCIDSIEEFGITGFAVLVDGSVYEYDTSYGVGGCVAHDLGRPPHCVPDVDPDESPDKVHLDRFCFDAWCYVNETQCVGVDSKNTTYMWVNVTGDRPILPRFSYATCGAYDMYSPIYRQSKELAMHAHRLTVTIICAALLLPLGLLVATWVLRRLQMARHKLEELQRKRLRYAGRNATYATARPLRTEGSRADTILAHRLTFHLFLSHAWARGQNAMRVVKTRLQEMLPDMKVFLDVDDLEAGGGAANVVECSHVLCHLCQVYFASWNCMRELLWTVCLRRPIIVVFDTSNDGSVFSQDEAVRCLRGAAARFAEMRPELEAWLLDNGLCDMQVPDLAELERALFGPQTLLLEWSAITAFQDVMLVKISELFVMPRRSKTSSMLARAGTSRLSDADTPSSPLTPSTKAEAAEEEEAALMMQRMYRGHHGRMHTPIKRQSSTRATLATTEVFIESVIARKPTKLPPPRGGRQFHLFVSSHNPRAKELVEEMQCERQMSKLQWTSEEDEFWNCEQVLVYLNSDTWTAPSNMAFAEQLGAAMDRRVLLLLVHEAPGFDQEERKAGTFERLTASTPPALIGRSIYSRIAVPLKGSFNRPTSLTLLSEYICSVKPARSQLERALTRELDAVHDAVVKGTRKRRHATYELVELRHDERRFTLYGGEGISPFMQPAHSSTGHSAPPLRQMIKAGEDAVIVRVEK